MEHSIQLLEAAAQKANARAAALRHLEQLDRKGARPGSTMDKLADYRAEQATEQEAKADDYEAALRLLKQV